MRPIVLAFVAALLGAAVGARFAEAGEPAAAGPVVCTPVGRVLEKTQDALNDHVAAGRTHFLVSGVDGVILCAW